MKKEKSCSLGGNEGFPTSISFDGRDRRKMTCIIHAKNKTETIVVSDSWNANPKNNHLTQKIVYNEHVLLDTLEIVNQNLTMVRAYLSWIS